jgi:hypothetical protein
MRISFAASTAGRTGSGFMPRISIKSGASTPKKKHEQHVCCLPLPPRRLRAHFPGRGVLHRPAPFGKTCGNDSLPARTAYFHEMEHQRDSLERMLKWYETNLGR